MPRTREDDTRGGARWYHFIHTMLHTSDADNFAFPFVVRRSFEKP